MTAISDRTQETLAALAESTAKLNESADEANADIRELNEALAAAGWPSGRGLTRWSSRCC